MVCNDRGTVGYRATLSHSRRRGREHGRSTRVPWRTRPKTSTWRRVGGGRGYCTADVWLSHLSQRTGSVTARGERRCTAGKYQWGEITHSVGQRLPPG